MIGWLEQTEAELPVGDDWLGGSEVVRLKTLRFAKRRADWRLGRWTAKRAAATYLNLPADPATLSKLEIRAAPSGAPEVFFENQPAAVIISISHRSGIAICAVAPLGASLGCDLEVIEPRSNAFLADYFTREEQGLLAEKPTEERFRLATLLWSAKESALKALHTGLRLDTRCVIVQPLGPLDMQNPSLTFRQACGRNHWVPLRVRHTGGQTFDGWWQSTETLLRTVVTAPPTGPPIPMNVAL